MTEEVVGDASVFEAEPGGRSAPSVEGLIAKLENADGGSAELDDLVRQAIGNGWPDESPYTRSVDAAMTLVPDGHRTSLTNWSTPEGEEYLCRARVFSPVTGFDFKWERAVTLPLALCIAALRARQAQPLTGPVSDRTANNTDAYPNNTAAPPPSGDTE